MNAFLIVAALGLGAPGLKETAPKDPPSLVGDWECTSFAFAGGPAPGQGMTFEFTKDGKLRTHQGGRVVREGKYTVAAAKEASEIDFSLDDRNRTLRGVYKVEGAILTICYHDDIDGKRPTKFDAPAGTKFVIVNCKRAEK